MCKCNLFPRALTHWGRVTHICVGKLTIIGSNNGLSPGRRQAITWTNAGILLIRPIGTNFSENLIRTQTLSFKKIPLKMSSAKWRPFCLGHNVLMPKIPTTLIFFRLITAYIHECSSANTRTIGYSTPDVIWRNDDKLPGTQNISWMYLRCPVGVARGVHEQYSPVKIWEDPPQIATKTK